MKTNLKLLQVIVAIFSIAIFTQPVFATDCNHNGIDDLIDTTPIHNTYVNGTALSDTGTIGKIALADFNNDGNVDLALTRTNPPRLVIQSNSGNGTFPNTSTFSFPTPPAGYTFDHLNRILEIADLNNDGFPDIITTFAVRNGSNAITNYILVFMNSGQGHSGNDQFLAPVLYTDYFTGNGNAGVAIKDFNGDGYPDLLIAISGSPNASYFKLFRNNGVNANGWLGFQNTTSYTSINAGNVSELQTLDADHDGDLDFILILEGSSITFFRNTGLGGFLQGPEINGGTTFSVGGLSIKDMNQDGRDDLVFKNSQGIAIMLDNSGGVPGILSYGPRNMIDAIILSHNINLYPTTPVVGDLNHDGNFDLVLRNYDLSNVPIDDMIVLINEGYSPQTGFNFRFVRTLIPTMVNDPWILKPTDLNGDGNADFVAFSTTTNSTAYSVLINNNIWDAPTQFSEDINQNQVPDECEFPTLMDGWPAYNDSDSSTPSFGNLDNDSDLEIVTLTGDGDLYARNPDGSSVSGWPVHVCNTGNQAPMIADLNGDGRNEVIAVCLDRIGVYNSNGTRFDWNGDGVPEWPHVFQSFSYATGAPLVLDLDPLFPGLEIVESFYYNGISHIYALHADGTNVPGWPIEGTGYFRPAAAGDIDPAFDGPEIVLGNDGGRMFAYHRDGTLVPNWPIQTNCTSHFGLPVVANIDGNDGLEIMVSCGSKIYAWHGNGTTMNGWPMNVTVPSLNLVVADLDPNYPGLEIIARPSDGRLYVWHADGTLVNGWPITGVSGSSPTIADLDGDGTLEMITTDNYQNMYAFHADGTVLPNWPIHIILGGFSFPNGPSIADIDHDGKLEIVTGSTGLGRSYAWKLPYTTYETTPWPMFQHDLFHSGAYQRSMLPNHPPILNVPSSVSIQEGRPLNLQMQASDPDASDVVTVTADNLPAGASLTGTPGNPASYILNWTPNYNQAGIYSVNLIVTDQHDTVNGTILIQVQDAPRSRTRNLQPVPVN